MPAALAPEAGEEPLLGPVTAAAEAAGVKPGMRLGEALATCPSLVLVDRDPAAVEREWEGVLRRLEDAGFAVEPVEQGAVVFETRGVERLYGGVQPALERALAAVGSTLGSAHRRRRQALHRARCGERRAPGPDPARRGEGGRGVPRAAAALTASDDAESLRGARGARAALARRARAASGRSGRGAAGSRRGETRGGSPTVGARRACGDASPCLGARRGAHLPRSDCERDHAATGARLSPRAPARASRTGRAAVSKTRAGRPARRRRLVAARGDAARRDGGDAPPARRARAEARRSSRRRSSSCASRRSSSRSTRGSSSRSSSRPARRRRARLREGLRQVRASTGTGSVCAVVEVAPWSRIPEARALVVPKDI